MYGAMIRTVTKLHRMSTLEIDAHKLWQLNLLLLRCCAQKISSCVLLHHLLQRIGTPQRTVLVCNNFIDIAVDMIQTKNYNVVHSFWQCFIVCTTLCARSLETSKSFDLSKREQDLQISRFSLPQVGQTLSLVLSVKTRQSQFIAGKFRHEILEWLWKAGMMKVCGVILSFFFFFIPSGNSYTRKRKPLDGIQGTWLRPKGVPFSSFCYMKGQRFHQLKCFERVGKSVISISKRP